MRFNRIRRLSLLVAGVLGLLATMAPPASATIQASVTFQGDAVLGAGLYYPCLPSTPSDCPPPVGTGRTVGFSFSSTVCVSVGATVNKPNKLNFEAGTCVILAAGVLTGHCGSSTGSGTGRATVDVIGDGTQTYTFDFTFTSAGGTLVITGTVTKNGRSGPLTAVVEAVPPPDATSTPPGNSCTTGATRFTIGGDASITIITA